MRLGVLLIALVALSACAYRNPTAPTTPAPIVGPVVAIAASELQAFNAPLGVYAGGATQIHVGAFGRDGAGVMRSVVGLPVLFTTDGGRLTLLNDSRTGANGFAVAVIDVTLADADRVIHVTATAGGLIAVVRFQVAPLHVYPGPAPAPKPPTTPTPATPTTGGSQ